MIKIIGAVAVINILARLIGFARETVIGYQYGTSILADSIITAYTIPNFLYIVVGGAVTTAFISVYSKLPDGEGKQKFLSSTFTYITILIGIVTALLLFFAEPILKLSFRGLTGEELEITKKLFSWMAPSTFFLVWSMWLSGILNVHQRFQLSSFSTLIYNLAFLAIAVIFTPWMHVDSYGLGALLGAVIMVVMLIVGLKKDFIQHFRFRFEHTDELKRLWIIALPIMLGGASLQFYFFIQRVFASHLSDGYIAALNYASKLTQFPQAVLMTAVTTVIYPLLAKKVGAREDEGVSELYQKGMSLLGLLLLPVTVFVFFYSKEIVSIIFEYGNFNEDSTRMTTPLLQIFSLSMFAMAGTVYVTRFFYAMEKSYLTVLISLVCVFGVNIIVTMMLLDRYGAEAIAWGTSISSIVNLILLMMLAKFMLKLTMKNNLGQTMKSIALYGSLIVVLFLSSTYIKTGWVWGDIVVGGFIFIIVFIGGLKVLRFSELNFILRKKSV
ncbi:MAG TPA: murein biosynthesis integral membrane protein MurJ [Pseudoneobacillus sp.]|nr:murein biosynthesis integral membrane protein MurJ [Pseudoneobacillus sp.]